MSISKTLVAPEEAAWNLIKSLKLSSSMLFWLYRLTILCAVEVASHRLSCREGTGRRQLLSCVPNRILCLFTSNFKLQMSTSVKFKGATIRQSSTSQLHTYYMKKCVFWKTAFDWSVGLSGCPAWILMTFFNLSVLSLTMLWEFNAKLVEYSYDSTMTDGESGGLHHTPTPHSAQQWHGGANNPKWFTDSSVNTLPAETLPYFVLANSTSPWNYAGITQRRIMWEDENCSRPPVTDESESMLIVLVLFWGQSWNIMRFLKATE